MQQILFASVAFFGACLLEAAGAEPLPAPVPAGIRLGHHVSETWVNGPYKGKKASLICWLAGRPAVLIYASEMDPSLVDLIKKLDAVAESGKEQKMLSSCVLLTAKDEDREGLEALAQREKPKATILAATPWEERQFYFSAITATGQCHLQKEAAVTVLVLDRLTVKSSYAFRKCELNDSKVKEIVKAASALLQEAKK
jgi:hypothetical protein